MKKGLCIFFLLIKSWLHCQIAIMGHNMLNNSPLVQTNIIVKSNGVVTRTLSTGARSDFKLELPFGAVYQVYFQNPRCPVMFMEVVGDKVPADKYRYLMTYELNVPFVYKNDEDVDTSVFCKPFYRISYNGVNQLVDDTAYNSAFESQIIRRSISERSGNINIGGKLVYSSPRQKKFFSEKTVYLANKRHTVIKKTKTNMLGSFVFEDLVPEQTYFIGVDRSEITQGAKIDILNKEDKYIATLDTFAAQRGNLRVRTDSNKVFKMLRVGDTQIKMDIKATIFGDNVNNPIGKLKILLLNDNYEVIDSAVTDNFGTFKFKYLPFLKRFYLSAENTDNMLDVFKNILIYSSDDNLIKIMTHQKGTKFTYIPVMAEIAHLRELELEDPMLEMISKSDRVKTKTGLSAGTESKKILHKDAKKLHVENILFEPNKAFITPQAKEVLKDVINALQANKNLRLEVGAHTDSNGSADANLKLSEERAKTVQQYILQAGIEKNRIVAKGYGETVLLNHCDDSRNCSEAEHAQNRRIEFKILEGQEK